MPIPALSVEGFLPEGVHECTHEEVREQFGQFQTSDVRCRLFERLEAFVRQAKATGLVIAVIVDGSFVTAEDEPHDVDLIVVLRSDHDLTATLRPFEYNVVSRGRARRLFRLDVLVAAEGELELEKHVKLFSQVRFRDEMSKGMLRIWL
jgi:hypothetical protein